MKLTKGKGVLAKDGTPYAAQTLHVVEGGMQYPIDYTPRSMLKAFMEDKITRIKLIDENNDEWIVTK